jgi:hypothetical protein
VPWNRITTVPLKFSTVYEFGAEITWNKPDGTNETRSASTEVLWYNLAMPIFSIKNSPEQVLVTGDQPTSFEIVGTNFNSSSDMSIYKIDWKITPDLESPDAKTLSNFGAKMIVTQGNWLENTKYTVEVTLLFQEQPQINGSATIDFNTYAPPKNGSVQINPTYGFLGELFIVKVSDYKDPVGDIYFNVFSTYEATGLLLKGNQLNNKTLNMQ